MTRWLCLHFSRLALEVIARSLAKPHGFAVVAARGQRRWIHDCDPMAADQGVAPGMGLATAYAISPDLVVCPRDRPAEQRALERLAGTAYAFSNQVSIAPPDGVLLEVGASLTLFGGLGRLSRSIQSELTTLGHRAPMALAPTPAAARLLTRAGHYQQLDSLQPLPPSLAEIPLACCEWPEGVADALDSVGAHTLGQALALPRDGVARRFGQEVGDFFDRLLGLRPDPLPPFKPTDHFETTLELPAEVPDSEGLLFAVRRLLEELGSFLRLRDGVIQRLHLTLHHAPPASPTRLTLGLLDPDRDPRRLAELVRERLRYLDLPAPVRALELSVPDLIDHQPLTADLFERHTDHHQWARLRERLQSRLGRDAVQELTPYPDHRPERAWRHQVNDREGTGKASLIPMSERPIWLLESPRRMTQPTQLISGPERIESGWWDGNDASRDYYIAETENGRRLWVYRDLRQTDGWYVHGFFA